MGLRRTRVIIYTTDAFIYLLIYSFYYSLLLYAKHCAWHRIYIVNKEMAANLQNLWSGGKGRKKANKYTPKTMIRLIFTGELGAILSIKIGNSIILSTCPG